MSDASAFCCMNGGCQNPEFCDALGKPCGDPSVTPQDVLRAGEATAPALKSRREVLLVVMRNMSNAMDLFKECPNTAVRRMHNAALEMMLLTA